MSAPRLSTNTLRRYFKKMDASDGKHRVKVELLSEGEMVGFMVAVTVAQPWPEGAFPQQRLSLERHLKHGHKGVHLQIKYHLVNNELNIGTLYIILDTKGNEELSDLTGGFVYSVYEVLKAMGPEFETIVNDLFETDLVEDLKDKKGVLVEKMLLSLENKQIEIRDLDRGKNVQISAADISKLLRTRQELFPLLGPLSDIRA